MKIGLLREWKKPADKRVALTPDLCIQFRTQFPQVQLVVESSPDRAFSDNDYKDIGIPVVSDMSDCDILLGIKEVPIDKLIPNKTYLFFSHTIKEQEYNRDLLKAIIQKRITLVDYETLVWPQGGRILGFGKWAGIVGTYNAFLTWGKKHKTFELPPAYSTGGYEECLKLLKSVRTKPLKIAFTGNGRVASGIREVLEHLHIAEVTPEEFINQDPNHSVFAQLGSETIYERKDGKVWDDNHFYENHEAYISRFLPFVSKTDILINGMYWEDDIPPLFTKADTAKDNFRIKVIADITCDVEGSVPITMEATDIYHPTFGWSRSMQKQVDAYSDDSIDVMAVTNLPTELPKNASNAFGTILLKEVLPLLINDPGHGILYQACITSGGILNEPYQYLSDFVSQ